MNRAYFAVTEHLLRDWPEDIGRLRERSGLARSWKELEEALSAWAEVRAVELARREAAALTAVGEENPWEQVLRRAGGEDLSWMEEYGLPVREEERALARFLFQYPAGRLRRMGEHIVQAVLHGFVSQSRDRRDRRLVRLSYCLGQEALAGEVLRSLEERGLRAIVQRPQCLAWSGEYAMAHASDLAACLSEGALEALLAAYAGAFADRSDRLLDTCAMIGIGQFGEAAGIPRPEAYAPPPERLARLQRLEDAKRTLEAAYLPPSDLSFCKAAYPNLLVGERFPAVFDAFYELNTMDSHRYELIQQTIIDALDVCTYVELKGAGENRTDLRISLPPLGDPSRETNFLNCGGDLNIPHGELFTTPRLEGTSGVLHVREIYLRGVHFQDLFLRFEDGLVTDYGCGGCGDAAAGRAYVREHLLQGRDTLPMGEFAIGSNTLAYAIVRDMDLLPRMPILLAEKMGPHIAVGDPCFARGEDAPVYNLYDKKEMVARENERTARRGGDQPVYTNVHTDITLAFDELERLEGVRAGGARVAILERGRFVLAGTEALNEPLTRREHHE